MEVKELNRNKPTKKTSQRPGNTIPPPKGSVTKGRVTVLWATFFTEGSMRPRQVWIQAFL